MPTFSSLSGGRQSLDSSQQGFGIHDDAIDHVDGMAEDGTNEQPIRRHRRQHPSSFLLETIAHPKRSLSLRHSYRPSEIPTDKKQKRASTESDAPRSHTRRFHHKNKPSIGNSPLINTVTNASPLLAPDPTPQTQSHPTDNGPPHGIDSDPAQIVNLALNLSASRQRAASNRSTSGGLPPGVQPTRPAVTRYALAGSQTPRLSAHSSMDDGFGSGLFVSEATAARAEKARKHFELFSQYLRLLSALPPLRTSVGPKEDARGRPYNPLQYIRNRKVRYRERCPMTEGPEWEDVNRVSQWVDAITESSKHAVFGHDDCVQLPDISTGGSMETAGSLRSEGKRRRPRHDWIISPSDLLADAAWMEDNDNKLRIEDRDGNKTYKDAKLRVAPLTGIPAPMSAMSSNRVLPARETKHYRASQDFTQLESRDTMHRPPSSKRSAKSYWPSISLSSRSSMSSEEPIGMRGRSRDAKWVAHVDAEPHTLKDHLAPLRSALDDVKFDNTFSPGKRYGRSTSSTRELKKLVRNSMEEESNSGSVRQQAVPNIAINQSPPETPTDLSNKGLRARAVDSTKYPFIPANNTKPDNLTPQRQHSTPKVPTPHRDSTSEYLSAGDRNDVGRSPSRLPKTQSQESRFRGMLRSGTSKGGRLAGFVENEMSRVGDRIRKMEPVHSRQSSVSSLVSDYADSEPDDINIRRSPATHIDTAGDSFGGESGRSGRELEKLPSFSLPTRPSESQNSGKTIENVSEADTNLLHPGRVDDDMSNLSQVSSSNMHSTLTYQWPPVTGLTKPRASRPQTNETEKTSNRIRRRDLKRTRAQLLTAGITARELTRQANVPKQTPSPLFLATRLHPGDTAPAARSSLSLCEEAAVITGNINVAFNHELSCLRTTLADFSGTMVPELRARLDAQHVLLATSLDPRIGVLTADAEQMVSDLATTATLAVKQLHDALDRRVRARMRQFTWIGIAGSWVVEWLVVAAMWCVWLVVMVLKGVRASWRLGIAGLRWVLWL